MYVFKKNTQEAHSNFEEAAKIVKLAETIDRTTFSHAFHKSNIYEKKVIFQVSHKPNRVSSKHVEEYGLVKEIKIFFLSHMHVKCVLQQTKTTHHPKHVITTVEHCKVASCSLLQMSLSSHMHNYGEKNRLTISVCA